MADVTIERHGEDGFYVLLDGVEVGAVEAVGWSFCNFDDSEAALPEAVLKALDPEVFAHPTDVVSVLESLVEEHEADAKAAPSP